MSISYDNNHYTTGTSIDGTLTGNTTPGDRRLENNGNEGVLHTSQISSTGASPQEVICCQIQETLFGRGCTPLQGMKTTYYLKPHRHGRSVCVYKTRNLKTHLPAYTYTYTHSLTYNHTHIHLQTYKLDHIHLHLHTYTLTHAHLYTYTLTHEHLHTYSHTLTHLNTYSRTLINLLTNTYTLTHIHLNT